MADPISDNDDQDADDSVGSAAASEQLDADGVGSDGDLETAADASVDASGEIDGGAEGEQMPEATVELSEQAIVALIAERDEYLDGLQRIKADFANFRRRTDEGAADLRRAAAAGLVEKLLPVLDSCDAAVAQGVEGVAPVQSALFDVLAGQGLARMESTGHAFDPERHEAVLHEDGEAAEPTVVETLRTGYLLHDKVLRAAMVKVQG